MPCRLHASGYAERVQAVDSSSQNWLIFPKPERLRQAATHAECLATVHSYMCHIHVQAYADATQPMQSAGPCYTECGSLVAEQSMDVCPGCTHTHTHLEIIDAVGGSRGEGNLLSSSASQDDLQSLHHATSRRHGVVLVIAPQEDCAAPVPVFNREI